MKPLIVHPPDSKWFEHQRDKKLVSTSVSIDPTELERLCAQAKELLRREEEAHRRHLQSRSPSDAAWMQTVSTRGTYADRISLVQLQVHQSPVHSLPLLRQLVEELGRKGLRESNKTLAVLKEVFLDDLLPPARKLVPIKQRPLSEEDDEKTLILWAYESALKECYRDYVHSLETLSTATVEAIAMQALSTMAELLRERPEGETLLLPVLANKLGHPSHRVGAKVSYLLETVLSRHANMRAVVVEEVGRLLFRKNVGYRAKHYGLHFLTKVRLSAGEVDVANKMIDIYMRMFAEVVKEGAGKDATQDSTKLLTLLISGVNRAFPYAKSASHHQLTAQLDTLYSLVHTTPRPSTSLAVLQLLHRVHNQHEGLPDRYYSSLYRRLLTLDAAPGGMGSVAEGQLLALLFKVCRHDQALVRVRAFVRRLMGLALASTSPGFAYGALRLCEELSRERPNEVVVRAPGGNVTATGEASAQRQSNTNWLSTTISDDSSDEEHYEDAPVDPPNGTSRPVAKKRRTPSGWIHNPIAPPASTKGTSTVHNTSRPPKIPSLDYNPEAKNPLFSRADLALDWELGLLAKHYHPKVAATAGRLMAGRDLKSLGLRRDEKTAEENPLEALSTARFLREFTCPTGGGGDEANGDGGEGGKKGLQGGDEDAMSVDEFDPEREGGEDFGDSEGGDSEEEESD